MSFALAAGLAAGAVFLAEALDTSFQSVDDLRAFTTAPILVSIPKIMASRTSGAGAGACSSASRRPWWGS